MNKKEIIKQFLYTLEDDIKSKTFLTYEEQNEWKDYLERIINSQTNKYKEVLDKIKEILKDPDRDGFDDDGYDDSYYDMIYTERIKELLEEIK